MDLKPVSSSAVRAVGYDPATRTLAIQFASGHVYHYHGVPAATHAQLMRADSIGAFVSGHIKRNHTGVRAG